LGWLKRKEGANSRGAIIIKRKWCLLLRTFLRKKSAPAGERAIRKERKCRTASSSIDQQRGEKNFTKKEGREEKSSEKGKGARPAQALQLVLERGGSSAEERQPRNGEKKGP